MTQDLLVRRRPSTLLDTAMPRSTGALVIAQIVGQGLAVATAVLLTRRLGVSGFGIYAFVTAAVFVANVGTTFGTDMVLIREIARDDRVDRCAPALVLQLALSGIAIAVVFAGSAAASAAGSGAAERFIVPLRIFSFALVPATAYSIATALLRGLGMMRRYAVAVVAAAGAPLGAVAVWVRAGDSLTRTMTILLGAQTAVALVAVSTCIAPVARARATIAPSRADVFAMARDSREVGVLAGVGVVYQRLAMLGVAMLVGPTANGWYSGAARIVEASKTGHIALAGAVYPVMADATRDDAGADLGVVLRRARVTNFVSALAVAAGLAIAGRVLVDRLYGPGFAESKAALTILSVGLVASCVATFESLALLAEHREREVLRVMGVCLAVLLVGLVTMVAAFGWIGACWAMLAADLTQAVLLTRKRAGR